jgi:hypothetical protein
MGLMNGGGDNAAARPRGALKYMLWSGIGLLWTVAVGVSHLPLSGNAEQIIGSAGFNPRPGPGKPYMLSENGNTFWERFAKGAGTGHFGQRRVHFVRTGGVEERTVGEPGNTRHDQFEWLEKDLADRPSSLPIIVFGRHCAPPCSAPTRNKFTESRCQSIAMPPQSRDNDESHRQYSGFRCASFSCNGLPSISKGPRASSHAVLIVTDSRFAGFSAMSGGANAIRRKADGPVSNRPVCQPLG